MQLDLAAVAARNNAEWCDVVARSHGVCGRFDEDAWTCSQRTPASYPDAVTLAREVDVPGLVARIDASSPGCSVKDSFGTVDLSPYGFALLFDAEWIALAPPSSPLTAGPLRWARLTKSTALVTWEDAWRGEDGPHGIFRPALLADESVAVLAGYRDGRVEADAVLNLAAGAVGVSNVFARATTDEAPWSGSVAGGSAVVPRLAVGGLRVRRRPRGP